MNNNNTIDSYVVKAKSAEATTQAMTLLDAYLSGLFPKDENGNMANGSYGVNSDNSAADQIKNASLMPGSYTHRGLPGHPPGGELPLHETYSGGVQRRHPQQPGEKGQGAVDKGGGGGQADPLRRHERE